MTDFKPDKTNTILRTVVGSTVHGIKVDDGQEDQDEMGVTIENSNHIIGFDSFEQYIYRSAEEREGKNARSRVGDLDLVIYSLRKYLRLALNGNPTILVPLFAPEEFIINIDARGRQLREMRSQLISQRVGRAFLGYLTAQKRRLLGESGSRHGQRPELKERYGWDVKFGSHAVRLGYQGVEIMKTGHLELPMRDPIRQVIVDIRQGKCSLTKCLDLISVFELKLQELMQSPPADIPKEPDTKAVQDWMIQTYMNAWLARDSRFIGSP